ncbi:pirin family protein [Azospirillum brasilense]|uniref:Pirin family protein n=1 Tax=Azospirillum brasilense TaxID=192 RepID=A0A0P0EIF8_AZOBR|nr:MULTISPECIES: pirin family protein [Azospirillum]ALJ37735.1 quercetin 2,3-dioxygenase [Azospirillum brasilense]MDW7556487.1 pirin family protein [Azospirillum brasilense]MDW7592603.1 pirin family protein [Azospirillum brasilense]MDW7628133.1 pirin family protein [Azospirillum brasilense]MDX5952071.1 pirin family protein [Azospirillum brasilense]
MITIRNRDERGAVNMGWLNSKHSFSFGHYYDPAHMGFRALRVINDDRVIPGAGFPTHGHADMEIVSYVLDGALEHKDTLGTSSVIRPGDVQRMSAGSGIRHSEYNASKKDPVHFLQIWILPNEEGMVPGYEQKAFEREEKQGRLRLVGSQDGRDGSVVIHQDVDLYATLLDEGDSVTHELRPGRHAWVQVARGQVRLNGEILKEGDGAAISKEDSLTLDGVVSAEVLLFDLA